VADTRRLPRGRHDLSRTEVEADQRLRILIGIAEAMADGGYANTAVAAVLARAGVSRETYYRLFSDKLDGFLAAFDLVSELLLAEMTTALDEPGTPLERVDGALTRYLATIAAHRPYARLFLIEAYAAGAEAIRRRQAVQQRIVAQLIEVLGTRSTAGRFACQSIVASVSSLIVAPIVEDDPAAILAIGPAVSEHLRGLHAAGLVT
jgi:AcrR family transcriptional regulator